MDKGSGKPDAKDKRAFETYWKFEGQRAKATQEKYEQILFSIWKNHPDYKIKEGFQIKCQDKTVYRVIERAIKSGLLKMVKNYLVGEHTRMFHKNHPLFDFYFRGADNRYGIWLNDNKKADFVNTLLLNKIDNLNIRIPPKSKIKSQEIKTPRKLRNLNYDIQKLYGVSKMMLSRYYDMLLKMNRACINDDLKFISFIHFDMDGLPTGRPWSYFNSTLNPNKEHKIIDGSMEYRQDFLKRISIPGYHEVYDMKSQFPRVNYLFHTGIWKDDDYDFYTEISKGIRAELHDDEIIPRGKTRNTDIEDSIKQLFMRVYFGRGSDKQSFNGYKTGKLERERENIENVKKYFGKRPDSDFLPFDFNEWLVICDVVRKVVGASIGNLIMWYAFFIETEVKIELLKRKMKVYNVYDAFYYDKDIKDDIIGILEQKTKFVYDKFMKTVKLC